MHDLGIERETCQPCGVSPEGKKEKHYPSIDLTSAQLPVLNNKKIGGNISLHLIGKIKGIREQKEKDKTTIHYEIELREGNEMGSMPKEDYMAMSDEDKDQHDEDNMKGM